MSHTLHSVVTHTAAFTALALLGLFVWKPQAAVIMIETAGRFCF